MLRAMEEEDDLIRQAREAPRIDVAPGPSAPLPPIWRKLSTAWVVLGVLPIGGIFGWAFLAERSGGSDSIWPLLGLAALAFWAFLILPTILFIVGGVVEAKRNPNAQ